MLARLDREAMIAQMSHISGAHFALAALLFAVNACLKCLRWLRLVRTYDIVLPHREGILAFFASIFYGMVTIGGVGEITRIGVLIARDVQWSRALVSCLFDRVLDVSLLSIIACVALIHNYLPPPGRYYSFAVLAGVVIAAILGGQRIVQWCASSVKSWPIIRNMPNQAERIKSLFEATLPCVRFAKLCELVLWTIISWVGYMGTMLVLADGLAIQVSPWSVIAASALGGLTILLPISFQGVGTREPMFVLVLGREGVSQEQAVLLAMLGFWVVYFTAIAIGLMGIAGQAARRRALSISHPSGDHEKP
ncbi:MAG: flippase-like domain-containing protein [Nannocystis sp.]|nr:flippase-like domain-containing protein [Nannocystis sp.]MBK9758170.1 flippase-like domain-containing protein [Nannocystis sp.]